ncbi:MAG: glycosyltransferase family 4 protein [Parvularculaceae bacterium]
MVKIQTLSTHATTASSQPRAEGRSDEATGHRADAPHTVIIVENMTVPDDRRVWQEATALARDGWRVSVICPLMGAHTLRREIREGVEIFRHPLPFEARNVFSYVIEYGIALFWEIYLLLKIGLRNIDVVQICNPPDILFIPAAIVKFFGRAKVVFDHHDLTPELYAEKRGKARGILYTIAIWAEKCTFALADKVISTNQGFKQIALARGAKRDQDVSVVYSAPDLGRIQPVAPDKSLNKGKPYLLLWVGIIGSQDGVDLLLDAVETLVTKRQDFHLLVAGEGPERQVLMADAVARGLQPYISFPGFLIGKQLQAAFSSADIGIGSDPKNDFNDRLAMNKVMEYMAYSLPIVMFDLNECRHIAGDAALYAKDNNPVALCDHIDTLMNDAALRDKLGQKGRARLEDGFSWSSQRETYLGVFETLVKVEEKA